MSNKRCLNVGRLGGRPLGAWRAGAHHTPAGHAQAARKPWVSGLLCPVKSALCASLHGLSPHRPFGVLHDLHAPHDFQDPL
jgi:hypothetical protein